MESETIHFIGFFSCIQYICGIFFSWFYWPQALHDLIPHEFVQKLEIWFASFCACQIAPAESPDVTERMVIITGTPEAQFKVKPAYVHESLC